MPRRPWLTLLGAALPVLALAQASQQAAPQAAPPPSPPAAAAPGPGQEVAPLLSAADALWADRDAPGKMEEMKRKLGEAEKLAPGDYGVLWRISRWYYWASDDFTTPGEERSRLGKIGWEYGDKATEANPKGAEGWFYATAGVGNHSLGMGVVTALLKGMEGKFVDRLKRAEQLDPAFDNGGIDLTWGRYYYELPWPKYDGEKSERWLLKALARNPKNVRARVYLAELYLKEDHPSHARSQLEKALAVPSGSYDAPEERRYQVRARELLTGMKK